MLPPFRQVDVFTDVPYAGTIRVFVEADAPRVNCREHGVTVAAVPWVRHGAGHTRAFDDQVAWLVTHCSKSAVVELMRVAWRTFGAIAARVVADARTVRIRSTGWCGSGSTRSATAVATSN